MGALFRGQACFPLHAAAADGTSIVGRSVFWAAVAKRQTTLLLDVRDGDILTGRGGGDGAAGGAGGRAELIQERGLNGIAQTVIVQTHSPIAQFPPAHVWTS